MTALFVGSTQLLTVDSFRDVLVARVPFVLHREIYAVAGLLASGLVIVADVVEIDRAVAGLPE